jgi:hypothetical protein
MPKQSLKQAAKARAQSAVKRATSRKPASTTTPAKSATTTPSIVSSTPASAFKVADSSSNKSVAITVPGLTPISPDQIASLLPSFNPDSYRIADPLSPPESLPQVGEADFEKGMTIYQGTQRALKLTGAAFDTTRERFVTIGKQVKAFGAGIQTATEFERTKGNYFDYLNQLETNEQKSINLDVSQHKTTADRSIAASNKTEIGEKQKQAEISAQKANDETAQKQAQLDEFRKQLGTK